MLRIDGLRVRFGAFEALRGVDLRVPAGEITSVLGPSGSGKTTLLRVIAGLERPTAGGVWWEGREVTQQPPHRRPFGLMFQDYALFPHRDVHGNVAFGLEMQRVRAPVVASRVREVLRLVGLDGYERRTVAGLSGGEQQRVALARALAPDPQLLMLDEPLGSLDRALRERLLEELRDLFKRLGVTIVYVTHDQEEAFALGDRVVLMRDGRVEAEGKPEDVWRRPANEFVARFLGFRNIAEVDVVDGIAASPWGDLPVDTTLPPGRHRLLLRPDAFVLPDGVTGRGTPRSHVAGAGAAGWVEAVVDAAVFRGGYVVVRARTPSGASLEAWVPPAAPIPVAGAPLRLRVARDGIVLLPPSDPPHER